MKNAVSDINGYKVDINCGKVFLMGETSHVSSKLREKANRGACFLMEKLFLQKNLSSLLPGWASLWVSCD